MAGFSESLPAGIAATSALGLLLAAAAPARLEPQAPRAQVRPIQPPMQAGERVAIGGDIGRYRGLYGAPEFRALDDEHARPWPHLQNIRTIGSFSEIPGKGRSAGAPSGRPLELDSPYASHMVCGEMHCLAILPVPELRDVFYASTWSYQDVEIIGAIDNVAPPMSQQTVWGFLVWSIELSPGKDTRRPHAEGPTLESLVRGPDALAGRTITVQGIFRGANLFDDLPGESRRLASDWVLQDGAYSVWVTGKEPKGSGWSLDPRTKGDCGFRLEVTGRVETAGAYVYLRAKGLVLLGRARSGGGEAPAPP